MKILVLSSVAPHPSSGGEALLHHHLSQLPSAEIRIVTDHPHPHPRFETLLIRQWTWWRRLEKTRLAPWFHFLGNALVSPYSHKSIDHLIQTFQPDLILTVASGKIQWIASKMATRYQIPLVILFHDWWPDLLHLPKIFRNLVERRFQKLSSTATKNLCVSQGMCDALQKDNDASKIELLYPLQIPSSFVLPSLQEKASPPTRILYSGNISEIYAPQIRALIQEIQRQSSLALTLTGPTPDWDIEALLDKKASPTSVVHHGFISEERMIEECLRTDFFLVTMSFVQDQQQRTRTSFPSKFTHYIQFLKPILIWAPEESSLVRLARHYKYSLIITENSAASVLTRLQEMIENPTQIQSALEILQTLKQELFDPLKIQRQFEQALIDTLNLKTQDL